MEKKQCPFCGKTVLAISKACKHCGKSFEGNQRSVIREKNDVNASYQTLNQPKTETTEPENKPAETLKDSDIQNNATQKSVMPTYVFNQQTKKTATEAVVGFILAIIGLLSRPIPALSAIFCLAGFILSIIGLNKNKSSGLAVAGMIIAILAGISLFI